MKAQVAVQHVLLEQDDSGSAYVEIVGEEKAAYTLNPKH